MDAEKSDLLAENVIQGKHPWQNYEALPPISYSLFQRKQEKTTKKIVISDCPVTFLIHYWYTETSILIYISFSPLVFHPTLR